MDATNVMALHAVPGAHTRKVMKTFIRSASLALISAAILGAGIPASAAPAAAAAAAAETTYRFASGSTTTVVIGGVVIKITTYNCTNTGNSCKLVNGEFVPV